jgi:flagellar hook-associated protein 2
VDITGGSLFLGGDVQNEAQAGRNAQFTIDGVSYERSSNQVDDAIDGMSFDLLSSTAGSTTINVSLDTETITGQVQAFVDAYNSYVSFLGENGSYNPETGQGGALLGDSIARSTQYRLRALISEPVTGSGDNAFQYLSQVGIEFEESGNLSLDTSKLQSALETDLQGVKDLFAGSGGAGAKMESYLRSITNSFDGVIASKISSIESRIDNLNEDYDDKQQYLQKYEDRLVNKFSKMEQAVIKYQSMSDQLTSMIDTWDTDK